MMMSKNVEVPSVFTDEPSSLQTRFRLAFPETAYAFVEPPDEEGEYPGGESTVLVGWKPSVGATQLLNPMGEIAWSEAAHAITAANAASGAPPLPFALTAVGAVDENVPPSTSGREMGAHDEGPNTSSSMPPVALRWGAPPEWSCSPSSESDGDEEDEDKESEDEDEDKESEEEDRSSKKRRTDQV